MQTWVLRFVTVPCLDTVQQLIAPCAKGPVSMSQQQAHLKTFKMPPASSHHGAETPSEKSHDQALSRISCDKLLISRSASACSGAAHSHGRRCRSHCEPELHRDMEYPLCALQTVTARSRVLLDRQDGNPRLHASRNRGHSRQPLQPDPSCGMLSRLVLSKVVLWVLQLTLRYVIRCGHCCCWIVFYR